MHDDIKTVLLTKKKLMLAYRKWASRLQLIMQTRIWLSLFC